MTVALRYERKLAARRILQGKSECDRAVTYEIDDSGFCTTGMGSTRRLKWSALYSYREHPTAFLFYPDRRDPYIIPKRAFHEKDVSRVRSLLYAHVEPRLTKPINPVQTTNLCLVLVVAFLAIWQCDRPG